MRGALSETSGVCRPAEASASGYCVLLEPLQVRRAVLSYTPSSRKAFLVPIAASLLSAFGSLLSTYSLSVLVPVKAPLEGEDLSQLPPQGPGLSSPQPGGPSSAFE